MRKLCEECGTLPTSHILTDSLEMIGDKPHRLGGIADVWRGRFKGRDVAVKALRVTDDLVKVQKVGYTSALESGIVSVFRFRYSIRKF
jgi:hypothetical protein